MRLLLFGAGGQLGQELVSQHDRMAFKIIPRTRADTDITDFGAVEKALTQSKADVVVNAAAYTKVDLAEEQPELAFQANSHAPGLVAKACASAGIPLIHISTDYVFDGTLSRAYREVDPISPLGVYGRSKADGEMAVRAATDRHVILRTSWVYGVYGSNFLKTILRIAGERDEIRVVNDQIGCPTSTADIVNAIAQVVRRIAGGQSLWGTYHFAGLGTASWYDFANAIVAARERITRTTPRVIPISTAEYPTRAKRPANSVLDSELFSTTFGLKAERWIDRTEETVISLSRCSK